MKIFLNKVLKLFEEIPECIKKEKRISSFEPLTPKRFRIKGMEKLKRIFNHYKEIDEERKETIFDFDFVL